MAPQDSGVPSINEPNLAAIAPPVVAPALFINIRPGASAFQAPIESRAGVVAAQDLGRGSSNYITARNVGSQFGTIPIGKATSPLGTNPTTNVSGLVATSNSGQAPPTTTSTASGRESTSSSGQTKADGSSYGLARALIDDDVYDDPYGPFVNPRPAGLGVTSSAPTVSDATTTSGGVGAGRYGAGGEFVNLRPDLTLGGGEGESPDADTSPPSGPVIITGGPDIQVGTAIPPYVGPPPYLQQPSGAGKAQGPDEQAPLGSQARLKNPDRAARRIEAKVAGSLAPIGASKGPRTLYPPIGPTPSPFVLAPGGAYATSAIIQSAVPILEYAGPRLGPVGKRDETVRKSQTIYPVESNPLARPDLVPVESSVMKSPSSEQDASGGTGIGADASSSPRASAIINGSIGAPTMPPVPTAAPPTHPSLALGSRPALTPQPMTAEIEAPPAVKTTVILTAASAPGLGASVAATTFVATASSTAATARTAGAAPTPTGVYVPQPSTPRVRGLTLTQQPEASVAPAGLTGGPTPSVAKRPTVTPENGPSGSAVTSAFTRAPVQPLDHPTRGGGGPNADGVIRAAGKAVSAARAAAVKIPDDLSRAAADLADRQRQIRQNDEDTDRIGKGQEPLYNSVRKGESANDAIARINASNKKLLTGIHALKDRVGANDRLYEQAVSAAEEAQSAVAAARALDPEHADAWIEDAAKAAASKGAADKGKSPTAAKIAGTAAGYRAALRAEADDARQLREKDEDETSSEGHRVPDGRSGARQAANDSLARINDRERSARIDDLDRQQSALERSKGLSRDDRARLRALQSTAAERRAEKAQIARRSRDRFDRQKKQWAAEPDQAKKMARLLPDKADFAAWQADQDAAAALDEDPRLAELTDKKQKGKLSASEDEELKALVDRKNARDARAAAAPKPPPPKCPNCPAPPTCVAPSTWVCTPPSTSLSVNVAAANSVVDLPHYAEQTEPPKTKPNKKSGGGGKAPLLPAGTAPAVGSPHPSAEPSPTQPQGSELASPAASPRAESSNDAAIEAAADALAAELERQIAGDEPEKPTNQAELRTWEENHRVREDLRAAIRVKVQALIRIQLLEQDIEVLSKLWEQFNAQDQSVRNEIKLGLRSDYSEAFKLGRIAEKFYQARHQAEDEIRDARAAIAKVDGEIEGYKRPIEVRESRIRKSQAFDSRGALDLLGSGLLDIVGSAVVTAINTAFFGLPGLTWDSRLPDRSAAFVGEVVGEIVGQIANAKVVDGLLKLGAAAIRTVVSGARSGIKGITKAITSAGKVSEEAASAGAGGVAKLIDESGNARRVADETVTVSGLRKPPPVDPIPELPHASPPPGPSGSPASSFTREARPGNPTPTPKPPAAPPEPTVPREPLALERPSGAPAEAPPPPPPSDPLPNLPKVPDEPIKTGIYRIKFKDGTVYVGQSGNIDRRLAEHLRGGNLPEFDPVKDVQRWSVEGGKTARETMEQSLINELGGLKNLKPDKSGFLLRNKINPIGAARRGKVVIPNWIGPT